MIFILEDDENIQEIESFALKNSNFETSCFSSAASFFKALESLKPELVLLDIMLPDSDGLTVLRKIRQDPRHADVPVIMVTAKTQEIDKVKGLDLGADDYLTKPFGVMELISRVKALLRRSKGHNVSNYLSMGCITMDQVKHSVFVSGTSVELTYKEYELLKLFLKNPGIVLTRDVIMERVWGFDFQGESRTVDAHVKTLRQKIGEGKSYIKTVRNVGYVMEEK